jgi:hypothetical protein
VAWVYFPVAISDEFSWLTASSCWAAAPITALNAPLIPRAATKPKAKLLKLVSDLASPDIDRPTLEKALRNLELTIPLVRFAPFSTLMKPFFYTPVVCYKLENYFVAHKVPTCLEGRLRRGLLPAPCLFQAS